MMMEVIPSKVMLLSRTTGKLAVFLLRVGAKGVVFPSPWALAGIALSLAA
jgi:hypothetical protein